MRALVEYHNALEEPPFRAGPGKPTCKILHGSKGQKMVGWNAKATKITPELEWEDVDGVSTALFWLHPDFLLKKLSQAIFQMLDEANSSYFSL